MFKFAVPKKWDNTTEAAIKFKSFKNHTNLTPKSNDGASKTKKKQKNTNKNKKKLKAGVKNNVQNVEKTTKIKKGRVEKKQQLKNNKKQNQKLKPTAALIKAAHAVQAATATLASSSSTNATATATPMDCSVIQTPATFQEKLKEQLLGGRFRFINEQLYTMNSKKAEALFREDPTAFYAYHRGYQHQLSKWPLNPLNRIIKMIRRLPKTLEIGDFGCGDGRLAKSVPNKVYSMDLVSGNDDIIACDIAHTPLKTHTLDIAVYCLSLMGTNLNDFLLEANRVLKINGLLYIAEIQTRFENVQEFVRWLSAFGFFLLRKDIGANVFYFLQFKKTENIGKVAKLPTVTLKPCVYRKR